MPSSVPHHIERNLIPPLLQQPLIKRILQQMPLTCPSRRPVQARITRQQRRTTRHITDLHSISEDSRARARRVSRQRNDQIRRRSRRHSRCLEPHGPVALPRLAEAPVACLRLADRVGQVGGAGGDEGVLVRRAAVQEAVAVAVEVADLEELLL